MSKPLEEIFKSTSPGYTRRHGKRLADRRLKKPLLILLEGPVGSGKTTWVHGFISGYLGKENIVSSPSYSLINNYKAKNLEVIHADFYRVQNEDDLESIGFWDLLTQNRVVIVEWGTFLKPKIWPKELSVVVVQLSVLDEKSREIKVDSTGVF